ncbi:major capsid family protein [Ursidibacter arcticus]
MTKSIQKGYISGRRMAAQMAAQKPVIAMDEASVKEFAALEAVGIGFSKDYLNKAPQAWAMDDVQGGVFTGSAGAPIQFLQAWLPGFVHSATAPRKIDELIGIATVGEWHDEEVVQGVLEATGNAVPYGDLTPIPLANWNVEFARRTVIRFEQGIAVGKLESARAGAMRLDSAAAKRVAATNALHIERNKVGFYGYNDGNSRTYGFLNDPALLPYKTVATGKAGGTNWATKTFLEITNDITIAFSQLAAQSNGIIEPKTTPTVLALPTGADVYLGVVSDMGVSVASWLKDTYPNCRVATAPQLVKANGGVDVLYLYAEEVYGDSSDDDNRVWVQAVPAQFMALGACPDGKMVKEDYTNATAGVMCKRPYAVYRASGI